MPAVKELLDLTENEARYVAFVQRALNFYQKRVRISESKDASYSEDINAELSVDVMYEPLQGKRDRWASRGVPYNSQDILAGLVYKHAVENPGMPFEDYLAKNADYLTVQLLDEREAYETIRSETA